MSAPFEWWLTKKQYAKLNDVVMGLIYSPLLVLTAWIETRQAEQVQWNRRHGEEDEEDRQEWELVAEDVDFELDDSWMEEVRQVHLTSRPITALLRFASCSSRWQH